jgi:hypothetical protein
MTRLRLTPMLLVFQNFNSCRLIDEITAWPGSPLRLGATAPSLLRPCRMPPLSPDNGYSAGRFLNI